MIFGSDDLLHRVCGEYRDLLGQSHLRVNITIVIKLQVINYLIDRVRLMSDPGIFQGRLNEVFKIYCSLFY